MDKTAIEVWIDKWGTNLDWESKDKLEAVQEGGKMLDQILERISALEKEITELKVQVSERPEINSIEIQPINIRLDTLESFFSRLAMVTKPIRGS